MPRILCIWLPQLPLDRRVRLADPRLSGPFAITAEANNAWRITHANISAQQAGVQAGQPLADARAICPQLLTTPSDPVREDLLLRALWRWADGLSPRVALAPPDGLVLDITGCAHLFGGEHEMAITALTRLHDLNITARIGIADNKTAARALAQYGADAVTIAPVGATASALADLPVVALGISDALSADLARTGLTQIGQLAAQKSSELARRYGVELLRVMGAALGHVPDPITPKAAEPIYAARMTLPEPIGLLDDLMAVLERLAERVCARLQRDQHGARHFQLTVRCVDTGDHPLSIRFARPCCEAEPILRQFQHAVSNLTIDYGADWFRLAGSEVEPLRHQQMSMGEDTKRHDDRLRLIETLGNRLGFDHVRVFQPADSHLPEHAFEQVAAVRAEQTEWQPSPRPRPVQLLSPPEYVHVAVAGRPPRKFTWRRLAFETHTATGPERLTPRWHLDGDLRTRDYWQVQTVAGQRLWLLTYPGDDSQDWYVAGVLP